MNTNKCVCCNDVLPEGRQVCAKCLNEFKPSIYHQAVQVLIGHCRDYKQTHQNCDACPLRHHCQNTIDSWPRLMLSTNSPKNKERKPMKEKKVKVKATAKIEELKQWIYKHFIGVYIAIFVTVCLIMFVLGIVVGQAFDKASAVQPLPTTSITEQTSTTDISTSSGYELVFRSLS